MRINQLPQIDNASPDDVFAININGIDYKVTAAALASALQAAGDFLTANDLPLEISDGGTGATVAAKARENLGVTPKNIGAVATSDIANNLTTTEEGKVLDARQGVELKTLVMNCGTISSLPVTINNTSVTEDMVVLQSTLGTPSAQTGDWTVTTAAGSLTISGSISGSTTLTLYLMKSR